MAVNKSPVNPTGVAVPSTVSSMVSCVSNDWHGAALGTFWTPPMHSLIGLAPVKTPLLFAPAGVSIVWSASSVMSKMLKVSVLLTKTPTFSWVVVGEAGPMRVSGLIGHAVSVTFAMHTFPTVVAWASGIVVLVMVGLTKSNDRKSGIRVRIAIFRFNGSLAS